jgi:hypothetical protein
MPATMDEFVSEFRRVENAEHLEAPMQHTNLTSRIGLSHSRWEFRMSEGTAVAEWVDRDGHGIIKGTVKVFKGI